MIYREAAQDATGGIVRGAKTVSAGDPLRLGKVVFECRMKGQERINEWQSAIAS